MRQNSALKMKFPKAFEIQEKEGSEAAMNEHRGTGFLCNIRALSFKITWKSQFSWF